MKTMLKQLLADNAKRIQADTAAIEAEVNHPSTNINRRSFLKRTALGGLSLGALSGLSVQDTIAQTTAKVNKASYPSDLKITDLRYALTTVLGNSR